MKLIRLFYLILATSFMVFPLSCKKLIQFHPAEIRLDEEDRNLNQKNLSRLQTRSNKDSFSFVVLGDSQRSFDELHDFVDLINAKYHHAAFVLLNGDITHYGLNREYKWMSRELQRLQMPFVAVIGNHDMLANGRKLYEVMFGAENFSFKVGNHKFIALNTNSLEARNGEIIPDMPWLNSQLQPAISSEKVIVFSHVPPFDAGFDPYLSRKYVESLKNAGNVQYSIHGHLHNYSLSQYYGPPVNYLVVSSIVKRQFVLVHVNQDSTRTEQIFF